MYAVDSDFNRGEVPVTFQPGELVSSAAIIGIVNDDIEECPELFELSIQFDDGDKQRLIDPGHPSEAYVVITDDPSV